MEKTEQLIKAGSVDIDAVGELNEQVRSKWRGLVGLIEERNKLIQAAIGCYKTLHQGVSAATHLFWHSRFVAFYKTEKK